MALPKIERLSPWLLSIASNGRARVRIFCFPHAGGSGYLFQRWATHIPDDLDLCAVELPGRAERLHEAPFSRLPALMPPLLAHIRPHLGLPFAFFGHSMGAMIAFELARDLRRYGLPLPAHLFVSGRRAPHLPSRRRRLHELDDSEFKSELRRLQGTPAAVLENQELMELMMPLLRADFTLIETYACAAEEPLDTPISVFGGSEDPETSREELEGWAAHTNRFGAVRIYPGDHFFLQKHAAGLLEAMAEILGSSIGVRGERMRRDH